MHPILFNVTLIHPQGYVHSLALKEAADYLDATLRACGYRSARTENHVSAAAYNIIFCSHLLSPQQFAMIPSDSIIFNSEQLEDTAGWHMGDGTYPDLLSRFFVWDYSSRNLARVPHPNKCVIPFLYCRELMRADVARERGLSLLFYGAVTPRRQRILEKLQWSGVPVQAVFGEYADQRDLKMLRSWAVLNLHKDENAAAFEPIRCFYPLINAVPVISEDVSDPSADDFRDSVFFFDAASFTDAVIDLYRNQGMFGARSGEMLDAFRWKSPLPAVAEAVHSFLRRR